MNIRHGKILLWSAAVLFTAARVVQFYTVLGADGFFVQETLTDTIIGASLYVLMALAAILALTVRCSRSSRFPAPADALLRPSLRPAALTVALLLFINGLTALWFKQWQGVVTLGAGVYYVFLFQRASSRPSGFKHDRENPARSAGNGFAVLALAYPCLRLILLFFDTFRSIKVSENILEIVGACSMVLMTIVLTKQAMGFEESMSRVAGYTLFFCLFGTLTGPVRLIGALLGKVSLETAVDYTELALDIGFWIFGLVYYYISCRYEQPEDDKTEQTAA